ncbi:MAG: aspartate/methionine/tyrosine aminotransferase [Myxococcota bacterium]|jgi:aspartate/methionine/tyrosine aminotransferase
MSDLDLLNKTLEQQAPALFRCLSPLGLRAIMPKGIVAQSAEASKAEINCSIGQITDGAGSPMPLDAIARGMPGTNAKMSFLYSPMAGHAPLRQAWQERQSRHSGGSTAPSTVAMVTLGLTQGVSHAAALFADPDTDVIVTDPRWGNYDLVTRIHAGARIVAYPYYRDGRFNVEGLAQALANVRSKAVVVLNFPGNPTGYMPTPEVADEIVRVLTAHSGPAVVVVDDAYQGLVFDDGLQKRSLYWDLVENRDPERLFVMRLDGATKELLFFPGRVGFISHSLEPQAAAALQSKLLCVSRGTVGSPPGPSQALVLEALRDPKLETNIAERVAVLKSRCLALRSLLAEHANPRVTPYPFNSGCFALLGLDPSIPAEDLRLRLLEHYGLGVISIPSVNAVRLAYCSIAEDTLPTVVERLMTAVDAW